MSSLFFLTNRNLISIILYKILYSYNRIVSEITNYAQFDNVSNDKYFEKHLFIIVTVYLVRYGGRESRQTKFRIYLF